MHATTLLAALGLATALLAAGCVEVDARARGRGDCYAEGGADGGHVQCGDCVAQGGAYGGSARCGDCYAEGHAAGGSSGCRSDHGGSVHVGP